jgi:GH24 family phage-related lysozyme (muramidase)
MSGDVYVTFGADTGALEAAMAKANAEVRALTRELSALANEGLKAGASASAEFVDRFNAAAESLAQAKGHVRDLKDEMRGVGQAAKEGGEAQSVFDTIREAITGALLPIRSLKSGLAEVAEVVAAAFAIDEIKEFVEHMAELGLETERASQILGVSTEEVGALSLVTKVSGASLDQLETQFSRMARNLVEETKPAKRALDTLGLSFDDLRGKPTMEQLGVLADAFAKLPAGAERTAAAMELFGRAGLQMLPLLSQGRDAIDEWRAVAERTGTALSENMVAAMEATHRAGTELGAALEGDGVAIYGEFNDAIDGAIKLLTALAEAFSRAIRPGGELHGIVHLLAEAFQILESLIAGVTTDIVVLAEIIERAFEAIDSSLATVQGWLDKIGPTIPIPSWMGGGDAAKEAAKPAESVKEVWKKTIDDIKAIVEGGQKEIDAIWGRGKAPEEQIGKASEAAVTLKRRFDEVLDSINGAADGVDELTKKIETLQQGLAGVAAAGGGVGNGPAQSATGPTGSAEALIRHFEGYRSQAYWDVNHYRVGYGSDTTTDASGRVRSVQEGDTTTKEDAERDLARRTAEFASKAAEQVGDAWGKISDRARASLTSMAYNYGRLPSDVAQAAQSGDEGRIAGAIRAHERDNGGVNSGRRAQEAGNIEALDLSPADRQKAEDALGELEDKRQKALDKQAGGDAIERQKLANLEQEAKGKGDVLKEQEAIVAAAQKQLDLAHSAEERTKAQAKLDEERLKLQKDQAAAKEADLSLQLGKARATGDPKAEHDASTALAQEKMAQAKRLYGQDSAEYKRAEADKEAADRRFNDESNRLARQRIDEEAKAARETAAEQRKALDDALSHKRISSGQWLSQTQAVNEQEKSQLQALYAQELALANQTAEQKVAIKNKEADALRQISQKEADDARKAADSTQSEYESAVGGILSSFTSAFKGMISGHETFRQAMTKALESLASKFIDMVEKMVVKWIAGELAKTTATTAGDAARTASGAAAGAAGETMAAASMLKSIFGSAGQAFAGVFGFMAPMMGPAAAGPAAAAEASVISVGTGLVAAADIGMWKVPTDQLAMIHQNELIMPAAQAGAFRDMLTGAANGGGGGAPAVHVHPQMNIKVGAMDASGFGSFLRNNQREMMKAMSGAVRQGAHLGLRGISP